MVCSFSDVYLCLCYGARPGALGAVGFLLTADRLDGIRPFDGLPVERRSCEGDSGIATLNARISHVEVEQHIGLPVAIDILQ